MNYLYSGSVNAFFPYSMQSDYEASGTWPASGVDVEEDVFSEFTAPAPAGRQRGADDKGYPVWLDIPPLTQEQVTEQAEIEKQSKIDNANAYMNSKQWPGKAAIGRLKGDELAQYNLWLDYLDALEAVDVTTAPDIDWPIPPVSLDS